ncbi:apolipoprotein N-acyltransferase [Geoalkalibacter halelectricus]|uniref:Apolipoprotein N-acyltransferase n=1 Tax=Geoalkalibacter halelectricus TaxID=2847045 RepID=A0ABY5ZJI4_9BACT|nr:apolipoprotein N-acyltransferase [Geoalkalibacter halelectricus]MDO3379554.1 apolipoprotein N-acyltransferase [Geoalkalibacter halelectricus]UWZ78142.1 apolipoprotein N-acyltransferase [Geoalkalibacter halelectricus]
MISLPIDRTAALAAVSGLLLALAFPRPDWAELAWVALVPLLLVMDKRPFHSGFTAGVAFFALVLYWLNIVMTTYGGLHPVLSVVAYLLLVLYLALFFGAATWAAARLREKLGYSPVLTLPVLWVALEFLRSFLFTGFPWASLGYALQSRLVLIQSADLFGVYGLSFLLVLSNAALAEGVRWLRRSRNFPGMALGVLAVLFSANIAYGLWRMDAGGDAREQRLRVALIQGNIDQGIKWDPAYQEETIRIYRDLSRQVSGREDLDLLIWPEAATPFYFQDPSALSQQVAQVPVETGAFLLFGSPAYEVVNRQYEYLNSAFLLSPAGEILGRSDKVHLVPFGEYVPLKRFLPFVDKLVVGIGDFSPGTVRPLPMDGARLGILVCYEAIFPELARDFVRQGSDLLINITNDAWFGRSSAPYQHLAMSRFRAVENRVWLARAANTGISAFVTPSGRVLEATPIFETAAVAAEVGVGAGPSLYRRIGDSVPMAFMGLSVLWLVLTRRRMESAANGS